MLWWKSHPSTVRFDVELFKPFRSIPVDQFAPQAGKMIPVQLNAEDVTLNERFSFARASLSWLSFDNAIKMLFSAVQAHRLHLARICHGKKMF